MNCPKCGVILSEVVDLRAKEDSLKKHCQKHSDKKIEKSTRGLLNKTLKIASVTLLYLLLILLLGTFSH